MVILLPLLRWFQRDANISKCGSKWIWHLRHHRGHVCCKDVKIAFMFCLFCDGLNSQLEPGMFWIFGWWEMSFVQFHNVMVKYLVTQGVYVCNLITTASQQEAGSKVTGCWVLLLYLELKVWRAGRKTCVIIFHIYVSWDLKIIFPW